MRPDDLHVQGNGPLTAKVESAQYHGSTFYCFGKAPDGTELYFCSDEKVAKGETVRLGADPKRVLIYAGSAS